MVRVLFDIIVDVGTISRVSGVGVLGSDKLGDWFLGKIEVLLEKVVLVVVLEEEVGLEAVDFHQGPVEGKGKVGGFLVDDSSSGSSKSRNNVGSGVRPRRTV